MSKSPHKRIRVPSGKLSTDELIGKIVNLANNINNKITKFEKLGNDEGDFYRNKVDVATQQVEQSYRRKNRNAKDGVIRENGRINKNKNFLSGLSKPELKKLYEKLYLLQNNQDWGTTKRYEKMVQYRTTKTMARVKEMIGETKFNHLVSSFGGAENFAKEFYKRMNQAISDSGKGAYSEQVLLDMLSASNWVDSVEDEATRGELRDVIEQVQEQANILAQFSVLERGKNER